MSCLSCFGGGFAKEAAAQERRGEQVHAPFTSSAHGDDTRRQGEEHEDASQTSSTYFSACEHEEHIREDEHMASGSHVPEPHHARSPLHVSVSAGRNGAGQTGAADASALLSRSGVVKRVVELVRKLQHCRAKGDLIRL